MRPHTSRDARAATVPPEEWWTNGRGWCFDRDCPDHTYGRPAALIPREDTP
jgi:hypothetical protein